jgi:hypothetical protein
MATTQPVMVQSQIAPLAFWERFQQELELQVFECNTVAGQRLWSVVRSSEPVARLLVQSSTRPGDHIECVFDADSSLLRCTPGPALDAEALCFEWTGSTLRCGDRDLTSCEALRVVLDELVAYVDED